MCSTIVVQEDYCFTRLRLCQFQCREVCLICKWYISCSKLFTAWKISTSIITWLRYFFHAKCKENLKKSICYNTEYVHIRASVQSSYASKSPHCLKPTLFLTLCICFILFFFFPSVSDSRLLLIYMLYFFCQRAQSVMVHRQSLNSSLPHLYWSAHSLWSLLHLQSTVCLIASLKVLSLTAWDNYWKLTMKRNGCLKKIQMMWWRTEQRRKEKKSTHD